MTIKKLLLPIMLLSGMFVPQAARAMGHEVTHLEQLVLGLEATKKQLPPELWQKGIVPRAAPKVGTLVHTLAGHVNFVTSVAWSPDGMRVVTGSLDKTAKIWDAATGKRVCTLAGHIRDVNSVTWSPNGKRVVTGSWDKTAKIWNAETGKEVCTLAGHKDIVNLVAWSPDGKHVATGSSDRTTKIWNTETGCTLAVRGSVVNSVAWSPDGKRVAIGLGNGTARVWDAETGKKVYALAGRDGRVDSVAWSPNGMRIATGSYDGTAKIWDAETGKKVCTLAGHDRVVNSVAWGPDGACVATGSWDGRTKIWYVDEGASMEQRALTNLLKASDTVTVDTVTVKRPPSLLTLARRYKEAFAEYYDRFTYEREDEEQHKGEEQNAIDSDLDGKKLRILCAGELLSLLPSSEVNRAEFSNQEKAERAILSIFTSLPDKKQTGLIKNHDLMIKRGNQLRADKQREFGLTAEDMVVF